MCAVAVEVAPYVRTCSFFKFLYALTKFTNSLSELGWALYLGYDCIWAMTHRLGATQELWGQTKKELPTGRARGVVAFHATCRSWLIQALLDPGEERQDGSSRREDGTKAPRCHPNRLFLRRRQVGSSITARLMTALCMFRAYTNPQMLPVYIGDFTTLWKYYVGTSVLTAVLPSLQRVCR